MTLTSWHYRPNQEYDLGPLVGTHLVVLPKYLHRSSCWKYVPIHVFAPTLALGHHQLAQLVPWTKQCQQLVKLGRWRNQLEYSHRIPFVESQSSLLGCVANEQLKPSSRSTRSILTTQAQLIARKSLTCLGRYLQLGSPKQLPTMSCESSLGRERYQWTLACPQS